MTTTRREFLLSAGAVGATALLPSISKADPTPASAPVVVLPDLPYAMTALAPVLSAETLAYHWRKHHAAYVNNVNAMVAGTSLQNASLLEILKASHNPAGPHATKLWQNAAQAWNHTFYWNSLDPKGGGTPSADIIAMSAYPTAADFRKAWIDAATSLFGSGWVWLVYDKGDNKIRIVTTANEQTPVVVPDRVPLAVLDVWEHAYYIDYRNVRKDYAEALYDKLMNWKFVEANLAAAK